MKTILFAALAAVAFATCSRAPVQHTLRQNGHTVLVINHGSHDMVVTPWKGAAPIKLAKGATVSMPSSGGPVRWDLTITDPANGKVIYQGAFEPGRPQRVTVEDRGGRIRGRDPADKHQRPSAVRP
jgi:hypothetical protein